MRSVPRFQIFAASAIAGTISGGNYIVIPGAPDLIGATPQLPIPTADQGWSTLGVNYSPGADDIYFDLNGDGASTQADKDLILQYVLASRGATTGNEKDYMQVGLDMWASDLGTASKVNVWLDNFRVYKSVYQLDLALGPEQLDTLATGTTIDTLDQDGYKVVTQPSGWDGTIDSYVNTGDKAADLDAIGFVYNYPVGGQTYGMGTMFLPSWQYVRADYDAISVSAQDHTLNGAGAGQSIALTLAPFDGQDAAGQAMLAELFTGIMQADGSGLYAMECYASTDGPYNSDPSYPRHPEVRVLLNEVAPNVAGTGSGFIFTNTGLPQSVNGDTPGNWRRIISQEYINDADLIRGVIQMDDNANDPVDDFNLTIYFDDFKFYKVTDDVDYFDAELFDGV
jgi:hypothetical protein